MFPAAWAAVGALTAAADVLAPPVPGVPPVFPAAWAAVGALTAAADVLAPPVPGVPPESGTCPGLWGGLARPGDDDGAGLEVALLRDAAPPEGVLGRGGSAGGKAGSWPEAKPATPTTRTAIPTKRGNLGKIGIASGLVRRGRTGTGSKGSEDPGPD